MANPQTEARAIVDALPGPDDWTDEEYNAAVESIAAALAAKDAELETVKGERDELRQGSVECPIANPCQRLVNMAKAHTEAAKRARAAEAELETVKGERDALSRCVDDMCQASAECALAERAGGEAMEAAHGVVEAFRFTAMKSEQLRAYHALIRALRGDAS